MKLYRMETDYTGYGPCEAFAWAETEKHAMELYCANPNNRYPCTRITELFDSSSAPFCTDVCDEGWPD